ncbi:MAG: aldolase/citrate lyase family protein, partial [Rhodospirillaceae bacterium]
MTATTGPFRTMLFAPGNHARRVEKALGLDADAVILDLEDAVAVAEKAATRGTVVSALQGPRTGLGYVRVNAYDTDFCFGDLLVVVAAGVDGIVLPKVETAAQLQAIDWVVGELEREKGLDVGGIDIIPIVETGRGVVNVREIAAAVTRVKRLAFGAGDYAKDMAMRWTRGEAEL